MSNVLKVSGVYRQFKNIQVSKYDKAIKWTIVRDLIKNYVTYNMTYLATSHKYWESQVLGNFHFTT